jgi:hypothetical protein
VQTCWLAIQTCGLLVQHRGLTAQACWFSMAARVLHKATCCMLCGEALASPFELRTYHERGGARAPPGVPCPVHHTICISIAKNLRTQHTRQRDVEAGL